MILVFIVYCILILWLFNIADKDNVKNFNVTDKQDIIINHSNDLNDLLVTIDSIKSQTYELKKINLIIFDFSHEDIQSILKLYENVFFKVNVVKSSNFESQGHYLDLEERIMIADKVLIIKSGMSFPKNMIQELSNLLLQGNKSALLIPMIYRCNQRKNIFLQLFHSFFTMLKLSSINKGILNKIDLYRDCLMIKRNIFMDILSNDYSNLSIRGVVNCGVYISEKDLSILSHPIVQSFYIIYACINLLFISAISMFVDAPSIYLLLAILIKIIPETIIVYSFYNRLKIKFPKIDFIIYLTIIPFYIFIIVFNKRKLIFQRLTVR